MLVSKRGVCVSPGPKSASQFAGGLPVAIRVGLQPTFSRCRRAVRSGSMGFGARD